ncbi:pentapeptide repeat-containing protein [Acanthopleuribacter pedis]|uniref:Pentapeptide repeat-containing protein n=1 Tax=Acanthopleuribacter pedis TaxID=442870 RepID=A0A8J7U2W3_9BACT|nr:pentapeptide repeat-containing protein [Acanthopleuribacter pedis]
MSRFFRVGLSPQFSQGFVTRSRKPCEYEGYDRETAQGPTFRGADLSRSDLSGSDLSGSDRSA